jgi:hypothetical protein|tara:strand:- start:1304 stop:1999 length:696 start_codon:yes stop_codon:yes gene_type:complete
MMTKTDLPEDYIVKMAGMSLSRPDDFGHWGNPQLFNTWGWAGIDYNRDAQVLDLANYQSFWKDIVPDFEDHFESERMNHWAVGWVERTIVKVLHNEVDGIIFDNITEAFCKTVEILDALQEYAILDEGLYSELEWEENIRVIEEYAPKMIDCTVEGWSEKMLSALLDNGVEMIPDADCYPSEEEMIEAAYDCGLCNKEYEEKWLEFCFDNNLTRPAIFQPKQTIGQLGMRI